MHNQKEKKIHENNKELQPSPVGGYRLDFTLKKKDLTQMLHEILKPKIHPDTKPRTKPPKLSQSIDCYTKLVHVSSPYPPKKSSPWYKT